MKTITLTAAGGIVLILGGFAAYSSFAKVSNSDLALTAKTTTKPINIDGRVEAQWANAPATFIELGEMPYEPNNGYPGIEKTKVEMRALYDNEHLYMLIQYPDPTRSLDRFPWVKQADGSWAQKMDKDDTGHENKWYEDKVAVLWDINSKGFAKKGCDQSCHMKEDGLVDGVADTSAGRHFTRNPGEFVDAWHWKSVRTNPNSQLDDQYFNSDRKAQSKKWGRHSDQKTGGGYVMNVNKDKTAPVWMSDPAKPASPYWIMDQDKVELVDNFKPGDQIPGVVTQPFEGPRADVSAKGEWQDGVWTLEIKRKLVTKPNDKAPDVQFVDLDKSYPFGVAVFDNSQINHLYHKKALTLAFGD